MTGDKYTKADIIESVYQGTGIDGMDRKIIRIIVDSFLDTIKDALIERKIIELRGFGTFEIKVRKGRQKARNPKTGDIVSVNSHGIATFRPGRELKQNVWDLGKDTEIFDLEADTLDIAGSDT
ncbi:MAG: integration host factor subunit beta [Treponema sp.]|jgi:integration host factor subunit beta|nr:integration host factor subunit beta [Treponema sp.]